MSQLDDILQDFTEWTHDVVGGKQVHTQIQPAKAKQALKSLMLSLAGEEISQAVKRPGNYRDRGTVNAANLRARLYQKIKEL